jgi:hypothetical protein
MARLFEALVAASNSDLKCEWEQAIAKYSLGEEQLTKKKRALQRELQIENNNLKEATYSEMVEFIQKEMEAQNQTLKTAVESAYEQIVRDLMLRLDYSFEFLTKTGAYLISKLDKYDYSARSDFELKPLKSDLFPNLKFPSRKYGNLNHSELL